ncbi:LOW QUALITY PROTEIN: galactose mutarotase [Drosophila eugracilis]|uniref:LOW QUALITY PROTEIN: galactose mutarotase n=1 Tax=Drosophila eugracilis TaxID=29029 RepID=UPI001BDA3D08|nr:LOW QUALITY PROTEIN: galactose mutarotase [Drosophila eugracilis]
MSITVEEKNFGLAMNPLTQAKEMVRSYILRNTKGMSVTLIQLGAAIQSVSLPDGSKKVDDVCLGFDDVAGYVNNKDFYIGGTLGRVAHRVANGEYTVDEKTISLSKNIQDQLHLNGGFIGFDSVIWEVMQKTPEGVVFQHESPHGHEGYPGTLTCKITYRLDINNRLSISFEATTDQSTVVNLSNHAFFNLAGHGAGAKGLAEHTVEIASSEIVETDASEIPTGNLTLVADTVFDLRSPIVLRDRLQEMENNKMKGYDNCYVVNGGQLLRSTVKVAKIVHPPTGRSLEVWTDQPALQFYTANDFISVPGKRGFRYVKNGAFCVGTQKFPDAMNHPTFPSINLEPEETYRHEVLYWFKIEKICRCCYK